MIILVRHGEATHHTEHLTGGWTDSELTAAGKVQLQAVASKLAKDFAGQSRDLRILTSDLKRAEESARIIAARLGTYFNTKRYDLARVGRYKINRKLGVEAITPQSLINIRPDRKSVV